MEKPVLVPHREILEGERAFEEAVNCVISGGENTLHIFDQDLSAGDYGSLQRHDALQVFLRKHSGNRLVIVLHDTDRLTSRMPRLINLLRAYGHAMEIRKTEDHVRHAADGLVIADGRHYVHRLHRDHARSILGWDDPNAARELEDRFQQLMEASYPAVFATTLGL
jgi:hypothetical protein